MHCVLCGKVGEVDRFGCCSECSPLFADVCAFELRPEPAEDFEEDLVLLDAT
jgi:hypothetical protein